MDSIFFSILGDLASRSLSFLIDRCCSKILPSSKEEKIQRVERMLLRLAVAVEDAEKRRITNHAMLRQLNMLRQDMYRGCYLLDTFRLEQAHEGSDSVSCNTFTTLSKFNPIKRARVPTGSRQHGGKRDLEDVVDSLGMAIANMAEFVLLLNNYPSIHRQPYDTYLFMDKCMFGRKMEMEHVLNFLLHPEPPNSDNLGVLPIIGEAKIGKSTLVEHVCYDERVRNHFSRIIFLSDSNFNEEKSFLTLRDSGVVRHKHNSSSTSNEGERMLVVVELAEDVDDQWRRMYFSSRNCISAGSKIIITSRSEKIAELGTTQPLHLKLLSREAYWYFFKVLAFGSSSPEEHPEVASISMAMFNAYFDHERNKNSFGPFIGLNNMAGLVQAAVYEGNCLSLHEHIRGHFLLGKGSIDSRLKNNYVIIPRKDKKVHYYCEIYSHCRVGLPHEEDQAPRIDMQDVLSARVTPHGRFDAVMWRSHLPPYYNYICSCEIHEYKSVATYKMELRQKRKIWT